MSLKFIKKIINQIKRLKKIKIEGKENQINLKSKKSLRLMVKGNNNSINYKGTSSKLHLTIVGDNNNIIIEENTYIFKGSIVIGTGDCPTNNCTVYIGPNSGFGGIEIFLLENDSTVTIGEDCMFSYDIKMSCSDTHSIFDVDNNLLNIGKFIKIGNHVWCGQGTIIGKNVEVKDNSIIGWGSVVTRQFDKSNVVIAGNPAKIVKENVNWDRKRPTQYLEAQIIEN